MPESWLGCDIVVALAKATADGQTLWGKNSDRPATEPQALVRVPGGPHAVDERVSAQFRELPQVRHTYTVLGSRPHALWGFEHGVNEHQLVVGNTAVHSKLLLDKPGLTGMDLVRLTLERCQNVQQAVDLLTRLIQEYGQGSFPGCLPAANYDNAFLIADLNGAVVLEAAGRYWALQEIREVRALSNLASIRQDWDRICPGLSAHAIAQGWWPEDGQKLDFAGAVAASPFGHAFALRRWGRATLLLEEQNGSLDHHCLRRILSDHYEAAEPKTDPLPLCCHAGTRTAASLIAQLSNDAARLPICWCAFGPPCLTAYLPVFLEGELPVAMTSYDAVGLWRRVNAANEHAAGDARQTRRLRERFEQVQAELDTEAETFARDAAAWKQAGQRELLSRQATLFMQHAVERFEAALADASGAPAATPRAAPAAVVAAEFVVPMVG